MNYNRTIGGIFSLSITDDNKASVSGDTDQKPVTVQLANEEEAKKMISEFEDESGDSMHADGSIFGKYPELHQFRP